MIEWEGIPEKVGISNISGGVSLRVFILHEVAVAAGVDVVDEVAIIMIVEIAIEVAVEMGAGIGFGVTTEVGVEVAVEATLSWRCS